MKNHHLTDFSILYTTLYTPLSISYSLPFSFSDEPYTIFAPQNAATKRIENFLHHPDLVKKLLRDHVVLGTSLDLSNVTSDLTFQTMGGRTVRLRPTKEDNSKLKANEVDVIDTRKIPNGLLVVLDGFLFPDDELMRKNVTSQSKLVDMSTLSVSKEENKNKLNASFVDNVLEVLSYLRSGVRVFQHFLSRSNVSKLLQEGKWCIQYDYPSSIHPSYFATTFSSELLDTSSG